MFEKRTKKDQIFFVNSSKCSEIGEKSKGTNTKRNYLHPTEIRPLGDTVTDLFKELCISEYI